MSKTFAFVGTFDGIDTKSGVDISAAITKGNYIYGFDDNGALWILNKTDPTHVTLVSYTPQSTFGSPFAEGGARVTGADISADGNTLYIAANTDGGGGAVCVIDVTDKSAPTPTPLGFLNIGELIEPEDAGNVNFVSQNAALLRLNSTTLLAKVFDNDTGVNTIAALDISDLSSITLLTNPIQSLDGCVVVFDRMAINSAGTRLYILAGQTGDFTATIQVWDMTDPSNPIELGESDPVPPNVNVGEGQEETAFCVNDAGMVYAVVLTEVDKNPTIYKLFIWDASSPGGDGGIILKASFPSTLSTGDTIIHGALSNDVLVVAAADPGHIIAFDVSNPLSPTEMHTANSSGNSVCFDYPYFFTGDAPVSEAPDVSSWLISTVIIPEGFYYNSETEKIAYRAEDDT